MKRIAFALPLALASACPVVAAHALETHGAHAGHDANDEDAAATKRLRGCLSAGSGGAPRTGLAAAVPAVRALCGPRIDTLADIRVRTATAGLAGEEAEQAKKRVLRELNDEIVRAIATFTGLAF